MLEILEITLLLRIAADLILFYIAFRLLRRHLVDYKFQLTSHVYGEEFANKPITIVSYAPCTIDYLRFSFRFESSKYQPDQINFNFHMLVTPGFGTIFLVLPFKLILDIQDENDDFKFAGKKGEHFLHLTEKEPKNKTLEIREFILVLAYIHETHGRRTFTFPIAHGWSIGTPFDRTRECPHIFSTKEEDISHNWYVPEVKLLDVKIWDDSREFEPELERMYPQPDIFLVEKSMTTLQWLSGAECHRPYHSSIQIGFVNKEVLEKGVEKSFKSGVMVAILLSLIIATGLDALWQILSEIPWCEVFKIAKLKLMSLYIAAQTMALPFLSHIPIRH